MNPRPLPILAVTLVSCVLLSAVPAATGGKDGKPAAATGQNTSLPGSLLACPAQGKRCEVVAQGAAVSVGDLLVALPGTRGEVRLADGKLRLSLLGGYPKNTDAPALPSAVRVHAPGGLAFDLELDGGRALLAYGKGKGALKGQLRVGGENLLVELVEPGTQVAVELLRRWPPGAPFTAEPKKEDAPITDAVILLLGGEISVRSKGAAEQTSVRGQVFYHWNSLAGLVGPVPLKEVPGWVSGDVAPKGEAARIALARFRQRLVQQGLDKAVADTLAGQDVGQRVQAVHALGAVGDLQGLLKVLHGAKSAEVRRTALDALRQRSARSAADDVLVYRALVADQYKPAHAEMVMQLLRGFDRPALADAATYQALIHYLAHDRAAVRELAAWHLHRLVPEGRKIGYDAAAPAAERARAQAAWRKLIPAGRVPSPPKTP